MDSVTIIAEILMKVEELTTRISELEKENAELRRRLNMDSGNSSKPPSSDSPFKRKDRLTKRNKTKRKPGGQLGHKGHQLKKFKKVDFYEDHQLTHCPHCDCEKLEVRDFRIRQVADIPNPRLEVTQHSVYAYKCCGCGQPVQSHLYEDLKQEVQYGPRIKALTNYLNVHQLIPYKRLTNLIGVLYGHRISQGSISNFNASLYKNLEAFEAQLKKSFTDSVAVLHSDETGCMVSQILHWIHVYSDNKKTLLKGHAKRGREAMDEIGILPESKATIVHDRWASYRGYEQIKHALCNAHLLRDLKSVESEKLSWPTEIKKLLLRAKAYKDKNDLPPKRAKRLQSKYEAILRQHRSYYQQFERKIKSDQKGKPKRSRDHNLYKAMWKYRKSILRFIHEPDVPFDNNQAERDLRMLKVKMKISNQFKTPQWMNVHARIRSFISTAQKQEVNLFRNLIKAHQNPLEVVHLAV